MALRFGFSLQILYDTFDLIAIIFREKVEFSSRDKMKKLQKEVIKAIIQFKYCYQFCMFP